MNVNEAILQAAEHVGNRWAKKSRRKQNGLVSFFESLAELHTREFVRLLVHALRDQQPEKSEDAPPQSVEDLQKILRDRGLPIDRIYPLQTFEKKRDATR